VDQFEVQAIIDTGDIVDVGSRLENRLVSRIADLPVPYLYVRGNHDSTLTETFVARQPNAVVLDGGRAVEVAGVRFAGIGDPLFRPNKAPDSAKASNDAQYRAAGNRLREAVEAAEEAVDVAVAHNPRALEAVRGQVPLVLAGHTHQRRGRVVNGTLELTQGSSGGAGLRTFATGDVLPLQMSVLTFGSDGELVAIDDVTVAALGRPSVTVERTTPQSYGDGDTAEGSPP